MDRIARAGAAERRLAFEAAAVRIGTTPAVVEKFYRMPWARLSEARPGSIKLAPPGHRLGELEEDYASMRPMLFGEYPALDEIVGYMRELERRINRLERVPYAHRVPPVNNQPTRAARSLDCKKN